MFWIEKDFKFKKWPHFVFNATASSTQSRGFVMAPATLILPKELTTTNAEKVIGALIAHRLIGWYIVSKSIRHLRFKTRRKQKLFAISMRNLVVPWSSHQLRCVTTMENSSHSLEAQNVITLPWIFPLCYCLLAQGPPNESHRKDDAGSSINISNRFAALRDGALSKRPNQRQRRAKSFVTTYLFSYFPLVRNRSSQHI